MAACSSRSTTPLASVPLCFSSSPPSTIFSLCWAFFHLAFAEWLLALRSLLPLWPQSLCNFVFLVFAVLVSLVVLLPPLFAPPLLAFVSLYVRSSPSSLMGLVSLHWASLRAGYLLFAHFVLYYSPDLRILDVLVADEKFNGELSQI